jgi:hypothetical protein
VTWIPTLVLAAAAGVLATYGLQLLVLSILAVRRRDDPRPPDPGDWPCVTVQLPVYDEPDVVERLVDAACTLDYPADRLEVQLLDDTPDGAAVARAAARVAHWRRRGVEVSHIQRETREGFKAGALAHGMSLARGEMLAVFDADFVPPRDFLRRTVPELCANAEVGLVQARWSHLNEPASLSTRVQAALLDVHFAVEQGGREAGRLPLAFNGTAGVWRRSCIDAAGGWQVDTLTEDLDLSYRAQMAGWRLRYLPGVTAPGELPPTAAALTGQQERWARGTAETARKLARRAARADFSLKQRVAAALHLGSFLVHPALVAVAVLHAPVRLYGPVSEAAWAVTGVVGGTALAGVALAHVVAARAVGASVLRRMLLLPAILALPAGLAVRNASGVLRSLAGERVPFLRTPKATAALSGRPLPRGAEMVVGLMAAAGAVALIGAGLYGAAFFQALFAAGAGWLAASDRSVRRRATPAAAGRAAPAMA